MQKYKRRYREHGDSFLSLGWPNELNTTTRHRVMLDLVQPGGGIPYLLDFGCGLSHFYEFLRRRRYQIHYHGVDIVQEFLLESKRKYPQNKYYYVDVIEEGVESLPEVDYVVANGVFTERLSLSHEEMLVYLESILTAIWPKARRGLAFNVMSPLVNWRRRDLFYLPFDDVTRLVRKLSRHFVIRSNYGLYEYTTYVYR